MAKTQMDMSDIVNSTEFTQSVTITRKSHGNWLYGKYSETQNSFLMSATVTVCNEKDLQQIPEADRVRGAMTFYTTQELFVTRRNSTDTATSDVVTWENDDYRICQVSPQISYGYFKSIGTRLRGD